MILRATIPLIVLQLVQLLFLFETIIFNFISCFSHWAPALLLSACRGRKMNSIARCITYISSALSRYVFNQDDKRQDEHIISAYKKKTISYILYALYSPH